MLVTIADSHIDNSSNYGRYDERGVNSDIKNKCAIVREAVDRAAELGAVLVHGGDLLDKRCPDGISLHYGARTVDYMDRKLRDFVIIGGNHEYDDAAASFSSIRHYQYMIKRSRGVIATSRRSVDVDLGRRGALTLHCLPANQRIERHVRQALRAPLAKGRKHVLVLHGGIQGADLGSMRAPDGISAKLIERCSERYDWVVCGDFHKFQMVNDLPNVHYCGAPKQMNAGDRGQDRGYQIVNLTKGTLEFVKSRSPVFMRLEHVPGVFTHKYLSKPGKYARRLSGNIVTILVSGSKGTDAERARVSEIRKSLLSDGGVSQVYVETVPEREIRNSVQISKDLPRDQIIARYVEAKDYSLTKREIKRHLRALRRYADEQ